MLEEFKKRVIGQDHVFENILRYIRIAEAGLSPHGEPKAAFLFLGPTGTGKTETAKAMAEILRLPLIRFDMSEYSTPAKWLADFAFKLEEKKNGVILLDEIEKGSKDIMDYFLQILSEARITFERKEINVSNFYFVMTSNIGSKAILNLDFGTAQYIIKLKVREYFRPEFLGRFHRGCILCYKPFDFETIQKIAVMKIEREIELYAGKGYSLSYTHDVVLKLVSYVSLYKELGARPIVQAIQEKIPLAILGSSKTAGRLAVRDGRIVLE